MRFEKIRCNSISFNLFLSEYNNLIVWIKLICTKGRVHKSNTRIPFSGQSENNKKMEENDRDSILIFHRSTWWQVRTKNHRKPTGYCLQRKPKLYTISVLQILFYYWILTFSSNISHLLHTLNRIRAQAKKRQHFSSQRA